MCLNPNRVTVPEGRGERPSFKLRADRDTQLWACGKCPECLKSRARDWAVRSSHELSLHDESCYITLTYDDAKAHTYDRTYYDMQLFYKDLRRYTKKKVSYLTSLEYGTENARLHFHTLIFGYYPKFPKFLMKSPSGHDLFIEEKSNVKGHKSLTELWPNGFHSFGPASVETAYYIASYALKDNYTVNKDGEFVSDRLFPSKNPAVGLRYFFKHYDTVTNLAIFKEESLCRYYVKKLEEFFPETYDFYLHAREIQMNKERHHDEYARLKNFLASEKDTTLRKVKDYGPLLDALKRNKLNRERQFRRPNFVEDSI